MKLTTCRVIMKHILLLFLLTFLINTTSIADGSFYIVSSTNAIIENINNKNVTTTPLISKQTYNCKNKIYTIANTNYDCTIAFSTDVLIKLTDYSKLNIDSFEQRIHNINELPSIANYTTENFNTTLFGSAYFSVKSKFTEETPMIISSSLANIMVKTGKFIVRNENKSLLIIMIDGEAVVLDAISRHKQVIKEKNVLVVVPAPKLQGRAAENTKKQNIFSLKQLDEIEYNTLNNEFLYLNEIQSNIKFIVVDKNVVGVKID